MKNWEAEPSDKISPNLLPPKPKVVQIENQGGYLYALDSNGDIWERTSDRNWRPIIGPFEELGET